MKAQVIVCRNPFYPALDREISVVHKRKRIRALTPKNQPCFCILNGRPIFKAEYSRRLKDGDQLAVMALPQGGGGGGSNPLRMVLMLAVAYFAPGYIANMGPEFGSMVGGAVQLTGLGSAVMYGAMMLVNALVPVPKLPSTQVASDLAAASPTYNLQAQGNQARVGAPIPVWYGRNQIYPDFAAMPYAEYSGNDQYLYQLLMIGQGEYDIEAVRIEDTSVSSFEDITFEVVGPGQTVSLFPANVVTSVEVSGQDCVYNTASGPFVAADPATLANFIAVDMVLPRGLYFANDSGGLTERTLTFKVEAQKIDDYGVGIGSWFVLGNETITAATSTPQRKSYKYGVASGRYQVKVTRTSIKDDSSRVGNDLNWAGLRSYLPGAQQYGQTTLIAMRMKAGSSLSAQASRKVNVIATRRLRTFDGSGNLKSTTEATRDIAPALYDICTAAYGAKLNDVRIDKAQLYALHQVWVSRSDKFNGGFDQSMTVWEALTNTARAGRAKPYLQGGIVHFVRDQAMTMPVAMFTMRNIVKGSVTVEYLMTNEQTADAVSISYRDEQVWKDRTVTCQLPGFTATQPAQVDLFGVTNKQQAWQEGMYMAACNRYRRRLMTFQTEMEGFIPAIGDLVAVQHDMPKWGQSAEAVTWNAGALTLTVDEQLDWSAGGSFYAVFRKRNGAPDGPYQVTRGAADNQIILPAMPAISFDLSGDRERTHVAFGVSPYIKARVLSIRPRGVETVELSTVIESDYVHTADSGTAPGASAWQLPAIAVKPVLTGLSARSMPNQPDKMLLTWNPSPGADHYIIEQSSDGQVWTRSAETTANNYSTVAIYGSATLIRVAAVGIMRGDWVTIGYGLSADYMWQANSSTPMWSTDTAAMWKY